MPDVLRRVIRLLSCILAIAGCRSPAPPVSPPDRHAEDSADVAHATSSFLQAFDSLNWPGFAAHLSDSVDAFWPRPDAPARLRDRGMVEGHFHAFFDRVRNARPGPPYLHLKPEDLEIRVIGDVGIVTFELADIPDTLGRRTIVFHREKSGWRIIHLHASNLPVPR